MTEHPLDIATILEGFVEAPPNNGPLTGPSRYLLQAVVDAIRQLHSWQDEVRWRLPKLAEEIDQATLTERNVMAFTQFRTSDSHQTLIVNLAHISTVRQLEDGKLQLRMMGNPEPFHLNESFEGVWQMLSNASEQQKQKKTRNEPDNGFSQECLF